MDEWRAWHARLEAAFGLRAGNSPLLEDLSRLEDSYGEHVRLNYHGHRALCGAFTVFFHDTLYSVARSYPGHATEALARHQPALFVDAVATFRSFRAAEALLYAGYPLDGYALLRDLKDEAAYCAALVSGHTDYVRLRGLGELTSEDGTPHVRKAREREERRLLPLYFGEQSGLSAPHLAAVKHWNDLFHLEVHGSRLTTTDVFGWFRREHDLEIAPRPKDRTIGLYVSAQPVVAWMHLRCLPFLQLPGRMLDAGWANRWTVLDESFAWMLRTWTAPTLNTGEALGALINSRFAFSPSNHYREGSPAERSHPSA